MTTTAVPSDGGGRRTDLTLEPIAQDAERVAALALAAGREGARVLVIRNTVGEALATQRALEAAAASGESDALLFRCEGIRAPYHARFAREDRLALDAALLDALGRARRDVGVVVVATQTAQQSLDIDADLLITDLCPADVLLQRLGRLHRHQDECRPAAFRPARAHVLVPAGHDLGQFLHHKGEARGPCGLGTVYEDLRTLQATWRLIKKAGCIEVPRDARSWVELATHPAALKELASELGGAWIDHHSAVTGKKSAQRVLANHQLARWDKVFGSEESLFPGNELDRQIATRLGVSDRRAKLDQPVRGAFAASVTEFSIPGWMMHGVPDDARTDDVAHVGDELRFRMGDRTFRYSRMGLERIELAAESDRTESL